MCPQIKEQKSQLSKMSCKKGTKSIIRYISNSSKKDISKTNYRMHSAVYRKSSRSIKGLFPNVSENCPVNQFFLQIRLSLSLRFSHESNLSLNSSLSISPKCIRKLSQNSNYLALEYVLADRMCHLRTFLFL